MSSAQGTDRKGLAQPISLGNRVTQNNVLAMKTKHVGSWSVDPLNEKLAVDLLVSESGGMSVVSVA